MAKIPKEKKLDQPQESQPVGYYRIGKGMMKNDNGALFVLAPEDDAWELNGSLISRFTDPSYDVEPLDLKAAKAWFKKITGGKAWVP
jgi:hypothetical protein